MHDFSGLYNVRDFKESDRNFIISTFLKGLYYGDSWYSLIKKNSFMTNYKPVIEALLNKCAVKVACLPDDEDVILGYSILSQDFQSIVWVHVKQSWRGNGIARRLCPSHPKAVTHLTKVGKILLDKLDGTVFDPFIQL